MQARSACVSALGLALLASSVSVRAETDPYTHGDLAVSPSSIPGLVLLQQMPDMEAQQAADHVCLHVGLKCNFKLIAANVPNALAYMLGSQRVVYYNPQFLKTLQNRVDEPDWSTICVFAHEIGHHLLGHIFTNDENFRARELEADRFAGFVLYRMGATMEQAQTVLDLMPDEDTPTHPRRALRMEAIDSGWKDAEAITRHEAEVARLRSERSSAYAP